MLVDNKDDCLVPNSGPVSKAYHLPPRRPPRGCKITQKNAIATMSSLPCKEQGTRVNADAVGAGGMDRMRIPRVRKRHQEHEEQQNATDTPTTKECSRQTCLPGASPVDSDTSASKSVGIQTEAVSPTLLQQRRDHWKGLHIGRDPYGLASKEYLDAGLPPPWPRCDWCEEEMPWLQRKR